MNWCEKVKAGCEFAEVSKLPVEEAMRMTDKGMKWKKVVFHM